MDTSLSNSLPKKRLIHRIASHILKTPQRTIAYTGFLLFFVLMAYFLIVYFLRNNIYCAFSDDTVQYYPFMVDFIDQIKSGDFSYFNYKNYLGSSFFSDSYYIPLDFFTLIILLLSFLMETEVAMSIVELLKFVVGTVFLCIYLSMKNTKTKYTHIAGLVYFSSSGITCFSCFPSFTSLAVYLPLSLIIGELFIRGKWQFTPLFSLIVVFYNFYLAYTVFAFMAFSIIFMSIIKGRKWYRVILDTLLYVLLILLGLLMSMCIFLPSVLYILHSTPRQVIDGGSSFTKLIMMFLSYIEVIEAFFKSIYFLLVNLVKHQISFFNNNLMIGESFATLRGLIRVLKTRHTLGDLNLFSSFFSDEVFYRVMGSTFVPSWPSAFYGYLDSYFLEHASLYITGFGILIASYVFFLKNRTSKVYKAMVFVFLLFMSLPFFSYIFSANLEVLYTRWMNVLSIPLIIIMAHVLNETDLKDLNKAGVISLFFIFLYLAAISTFHHLVKLSELAEVNRLSENLISFMNYMYMSAGAILLSFFVFFIFAYIIRKGSKKLKSIAYPLISSLLVASIILIVVNLTNKYNSFDKSTLEFTLNIKDPLYDPESMLAIQYLSILTLLLMMFVSFALIIKNKKILYGVLALEVIISACLSFGLPVIYSGEATMYKKTHNLSELIEEKVDDDSLYRIYLSPSVSGILGTNVSRFMPKGTNQNIFHSFVTNKTDGVTDLLFGVKSEGQAGKKKINTYSESLNILLGYKYIVAPKESSFSSYDINKFEEIYTDNEYIILKVKNYEEFLYFDNISSRESFNSIKSKLSTVSQKTNFLLNYGVSEKEEDEIINRYMTYSDVSSYISSTKTHNVAQKETLDLDSYVEIESEEYSYYSFDESNYITTRSYAINIGGLISTADEIIDGESLIIEFSNGERYIVKDINKRNMNSSTFHIPVYGSQNGDLKINGSSEYTIVSDNGLAPYPKGIYLKSTYAPNRLTVGVEAIFPNVSNLDEYEGRIVDSSDSLGAYFRYNVLDKISIDSLISLSFAESFNPSTIIAALEDGSYTIISSEFTAYDLVKYIYVSKDSFASNKQAPSMTISSIKDDNEYSDNISNKEIYTKKSSIILSYTNNNKSDTYSVIMLPYTYSSEWKIVSGEVQEIIPINGGFIGLIVPNNIDNNLIEITFNPEGLKEGIGLTLIGILTYTISLVMYQLLRDKKKLKGEEFV